MDRYAIFVDAGYVTAQALRILSGKTQSERSELKLLDPSALIVELTRQAQAAFGHDRLLRTYWYDGVGLNMTAEQTSIAVLPDVQFRAGTIHNRKQKGVDSRIVHDLFELASNRAIADAMVVTGDGDLAVGIEFAQRRGMRVALLSIEDVPSGVSANRHQELTYLADRQLAIGRKEVERLFRYEPKGAETTVSLATVAVARAAPWAAKAAPAASSSQASDEQLRAAVDQLLSELPPTSRAAALNTAGGIIAEIDKQLLSKARTIVGRMLHPPERAQLRTLFTTAVKSAGA